MAVMMLMVLQTMTFDLRISFGVSSVTYGGTKFNPTMSLAQYNRAAFGVSTVQIEVHKCLDYSIELMGAWLGTVFTLSVIYMLTILTSST